MNQKFIIKDQCVWNHHRSGWAYVINSIQRELCSIRGVLFEGYVDGLAVREATITEPWVGFVHNPITIPPEAYAIWPKMMAVDKMLQSKMWHNSKDLCLGLFTLSQECCDYLSEKTGLIVSKLLHPTEPGIKFSVDRYLCNDDKKLISIGQWLRNFSEMPKIKTDLRKVVLGTQSRLTIPDGLDKMERLTNNEYDELLAENIVFLDLYAANANNAIIECMVRHTPLIVRRHPSIAEYLGTDYPLFFEDIREVHNMCTLDNIINAHDYLSKWHITQRLKLEYFMQDMKSSNVYNSL